MTSSTYDGSSPAPGLPVEPTVFAVRDTAAGPELVWRRAVLGGRGIAASLARDPRGGVWMYSILDSHVVRLDEIDGAEIERIDVDELLGLPATQLPHSAISIAGSDTRPIMLLGTTPSFIGQSLLVAIDLAAKVKLWSVQASPFALRSISGVFGQFPVLENGTHTRVVALHQFSGVMAVGAQ